MPMGFSIYPDFRLLFIRGHGLVTQTERVQTMLAWLRDPGYVHCTSALFDVTDAETTPRLFEMRELLGLLNQHRPANGPQKLAIITGRPITFVVARAFERLVQLKTIPLHVKVFLDRESAWAWLRPDDVLPIRDRLPSLERAHEQ
jgi:hypothetical protein